MGKISSSTLCSECVYSSVCKYSETFKMDKTDIFTYLSEKYFNGDETDNCTNITVNCEYYKQEKINIGGTNYR